MLVTETKERPIIFSIPMIQAILEGRKTQTRRVKVTFISRTAYIPNYITGEPQSVKYPCPYGQIGDRLWVRETFSYINNTWTSFRQSSPPSDGWYFVLWEPNDKLWDYVKLTRVQNEYQDDLIDHDVERWVWQKTDSDDPESICLDIANPLNIQWKFSQEQSIVFKADNPKGLISRWRPSIYMPRSASRITLEITDIRVERLQDISGEDCHAEGIQIFTGDEVCDPTKLSLLYRDQFVKLWQSINFKKHPWDSNPWVWVIEFKRV